MVAALGRPGTGDDCKRHLGPVAFDLMEREIKALL